MRPLVIVCEASRAAPIREGLRIYCHPQILKEFVLVLPIDTDVEASFEHEKHILVEWLRQDRAGATEKPLICATHDAANAIRVRLIAAAFGIELKKESAALLVDHSNSNGSPKIFRLLNQCGLSLHAASASMFQHWHHATVNRQAVDSWVEQFALLGPYKWIAETILGCTRLIEQAELGDMLKKLNLDAGVALCVNRDPRGGAKSGEIVQNLLGKRSDRAVPICSSAADAIDNKGMRRVAIFEDGLWSGTEAIGVIESLLGERKPESIKTVPLKDGAIFSGVEVTLAYAVATDYGKAMVGRFLRDRRLENVTVWSDQELAISTAALRERLDSSATDFKRLRDYGPPPDELSRRIFEALEAQGRTPAEVAQAKDFLATVGRQLLDHYLESMVREKQWTPWTEEKRNSASLGMHGLSLTHAFSHSVPKATLPLLWGSGDVVIGAKRVIWRALFANS